jgi:hypothetical protein
MDKLVSRAIALEDIPVRTDVRTPIGRAGQLWAWLRSAPAEAALEVDCRDGHHIHFTHAALRTKARKAGIAFYWSRNENQYYVSKSPIEGGQKAW